MCESRNFIRKVKYLGNSKSSGSIRYYLKRECGDFSITKIIETVNQIKNDFPKANDNQICINFIDFYTLEFRFYCSDIPESIVFDEVLS